MAHRDRKVHRKRGQKTSGWGGRQKHRGAGHRGGVGMAGTSNHRWVWITKYDPSHFLSIGFTRHKSLIKNINAVNAGFLSEKIEELSKNGIVKEDGGKFNINLTELGFDKLLGSGKVSHPLVITVSSCSKLAKQKVEAAGGSIVFYTESELEGAVSGEAAAAEALED